MRVWQAGRVLKVITIGMLVLAAFVGVLTSRTTAHAAAKATYNIMAGANLDVGVDVLAFFPPTVKVHRGDTITWTFDPVHNVHFATKPVDSLLTPGDVDGKTLPLLNPVVAVPNVQPGDSYKDGLNTGLVGTDPSNPTFTIVMDAAPGTYTYLCDLHSGMIGTIIVVDDNTTIPTPDDVVAEGKKGVADVLANAQLTYLKAGDAAIPQPKTGADSLAVSAGFTAGTASINRFFPNVGVITAGQSVQWTVPAGLEAHTINFPLPADGNIPDTLAVVTDSKNVPHLIFGQTLIPTTKTGDSYSDTTVASGLILPGQSFALKFPKAGVYKYYCAIHPGQLGTIVVLPASGS